MTEKKFEEFASKLMNDWPEVQAADWDKEESVLAEAHKALARDLEVMQTRCRRRLKWGFYGEAPTTLDEVAGAIEKDWPPEG